MSPHSHHFIPLSSCHPTITMSPHSHHVTPLSPCHPTLIMSPHSHHVAPLSSCRPTLIMFAYSHHVTPLSSCHPTLIMFAYSHHVTPLSSFHPILTFSDNELFALIRLSAMLSRTSRCLLRRCFFVWSCSSFRVADSICALSSCSLVAGTRGLEFSGDAFAASTAGEVLKTTSVMEALPLISTLKKERKNMRRKYIYRGHTRGHTRDIQGDTQGDTDLFGYCVTLCDQDTRLPLATIIC